MLSLTIDWFPMSKQSNFLALSEKWFNKFSYNINIHFLDYAEFGCNSCRKVLNQPLSMPCGHNFCKGCLEIVFAGQDSTRERKGVSGRSLRTQKVTKLCPTCKADISDFLLSPQVLEVLGTSIIEYYFVINCLQIKMLAG